MAMETCVLNCPVAEVIQLLKGLLKRQGYEIEKIDLTESVVLAFRNGKWFSQKQTVSFQISSIEANFTRVDVTATIDGKNKSREAEEVLEEKIVSGIYDFIR